MTETMVKMESRNHISMFRLWENRKKAEFENKENDMGTTKIQNTRWYTTKVSKRDETPLS